MSLRAVAWQSRSQCITAGAVRLCAATRLLCRSLALALLTPRNDAMVSGVKLKHLIKMWLISNDGWR
jgi:hypothetical protein